MALKPQEFTENDLQNIINHILLPEERVKILRKKIMDKFYHFPNVIDITTTPEKGIYIVGDIHGQFNDFLEIFKTTKDTEYSNLKNSYVFLGDYVDRGYFSLEVLQFLCILFLLNEDKITLLRGNHEIRQISSVYGFNEECQKRYGFPSIYTLFMEMLDLFPLAAVVTINNDRTFCVHGGISPDIKSIKQIMSVDRNREIPIEDHLADFLWSDPEEDQEKLFQKNSRGSGHIFNKVACEEFCDKNKVNRIIRSHQLAHEGFKKFFNGKLWIVWSAPNYCYREGNKASILKLTGNEVTEKDFIIFEKSINKDEDIRNDYRLP